MTRFYKTNTKSFKRKNKKSIFSRFKFNFRSINILVICLILVTGFLYLVQVNDTATKGYQIRELEQHIKDLKDSNRKMELNVMELSSIKSVQERIDGLSLVAVNQVDYITGSSAVAAAR